MRRLLLILSIAFAVYGLLPYRKATSVDTKIPNQIVVDQQECGCPCPDARVLQGKLEIPDEIIAEYPSLDTTQINLDIKNFNTPYNFELGNAKLYVKGKVIGADTILCDPTNCELAPRFQVNEWALVDTVEKFWTFHRLFFAFYLFNLILIAPTFIIMEIIKEVKRIKAKQGGR